MKKLILFLFILIHYYTVVGQASYELLDTTNIWSSYETKPFYSNNNTISYVKDTTISGDIYRKFNIDILYYNNTHSVASTYLREHNNYITRFRQNSNGSIIDTLYNFNAKVNDFIGFTNNDTPPFHDSVFVMQIDSVLIDSTYRKRWINGLNGTTTSIWVDGIGSLNGFFYSIFKSSTSAHNSSTLLCFSNQAKTVYMDSFYNTCFVSTGIENKSQTKNTVTITPNPITDNGIIKYNNPNNLHLTIRIYNILGQVVLQEPLNANNEIKLSNDMLPAGQYIYQLFTAKSIIARGKFMVD